jgi:endoglucanase
MLTFLRRALLCCWLASSAVMMFGQAAEGDVAFKRAQHLSHGINTAIWFAQAPGRYDVERLRSFTTADDLKLIYAMGFDHIRLSVDATPLVSWKAGEPGGKAFMAELDRAIQQALDDKLAVVIDLHPEEAYKTALLTGDDSSQQYVALWGSLAAHFSKLDPERVFFELMNESEQTDDARWRLLQTSALMEIRDHAPGFTVIASGLHFDGLLDLLAFMPLPDANVIYSFHEYNPMAFTHQGATWISPFFEVLRKVPYPSTPENVATILPEETNILGQYYLEQYGLERWDAERIKTEIAFARQWADLRHVPVYCGEFGAHRPYVEPAARERWLHDMRVALESEKIGWAMWDYQTDFGVVTKADGKTTPDEGVLKALGLTPNK